MPVISLHSPYEPVKWRASKAPGGLDSPLKPGRKRETERDREREREGEREREREKERKRERERERENSRGTSVE